MSENYERELGWEDEISKESEFILLPEGDYDFTVSSFTRGRHDGSEKLPPCNKAIMSLTIKFDKGDVTLTHNLFMHSKCEGMISAFLLAIGQKKHGEPAKPRWNEMVGLKGRCKIGIHKWISNKTGEEMESNDIKKFYELPTATQKSTTDFTPGQF